MALGILKTTKIDVGLLGILIVSLAYQVRKNLNRDLNGARGIFLRAWVYS